MSFPADGSRGAAAIHRKMKGLVAIKRLSDNPS